MKNWGSDGPQAVRLRLSWSDFPKDLGVSSGV